MPDREEEPHDILAAEEFAMPTRDGRYPPDPSGIPGPHDVLAADEFAMPTPGVTPSSERGGLPVAPFVLGIVAALGLLFARRRRRR